MTARRMVNMTKINLGHGLFQTTNGNGQTTNTNPPVKLFMER